MSSTYCSAIDCNSSFYKKGSVRTEFSFFKIPSDKKTQTRWCNLIKRQHGRDGFDARKARLCQKHFRESDLIHGLGSCKMKRLRKGAEPIPYSSHSLSKVKLASKSRQPPKSREAPVTPVRPSLPIRQSPRTKKSATTPLSVRQSPISKKIRQSPKTKKSAATPLPIRQSPRSKKTIKIVTPGRPSLPIRHSPRTEKSAATPLPIRQSPRSKKTLTLSLSDQSTHEPKTFDASVQCDILTEEIQRLEKEVNALKEKLDDVSDHNQHLQEYVIQLTGENNEYSNRQFSYENLTDKDVHFYTGFPNMEVLELMYGFLDPGDLCENMVFYQPGKEYNQESKEGWKKGPYSKLGGRDLLLMTLCRLRQGFLEEHLAKLFNISVPAVSRGLISMLNFMYIKLGSLPIWPSREQVDQSMPADFRKKYPTTRCIIDCTEIYTQCPAALRNQSMLYSHYKGRTTYKALVGIIPGGGASFISALYPGSLSDRAIVERCGLLQRKLWNVGDSVMADRGFTVDDLLEPLGVSLNIPAFLKGRAQLSKEEVVETQQIASWRIHVERYIGRIKRFHIFDRPIPLAMHGTINQIWTVCAMLVNADNPLISFELDED